MEDFTDDELREQILWEHECVTRGLDKYMFQQDRLRNTKNGSNTEAVQYLMRTRIPRIAKNIEEQASRVVGRCAHYNRILQNATVDGNYNRLAYFGMQVVFSSIEHEKWATVTRICNDIGKKVEVDLKCTMFQASEPLYYAEVLKSLKDRSKGYRRKQNRFMDKFDDFDMQWTDWSSRVRLNIGSKILKAVMQEFWDALSIGKRRIQKFRTSVVKATPEFIEWLHEFEETRGMMLTPLLPTKITPRDWTNINAGGYYTRQMQSQIPFVRTFSREHKQFILDNLPTKHMAAVNVLQRTPWKINERVLDVQSTIYKQSLEIGIPGSKEQELPPFPEHLPKNKDLYTDAMKQEFQSWKQEASAVYRAEEKRKSKLTAFTTTHKIAQEIRNWDKFHYVFKCDARGRIYCATPGLSQQGTDFAKGLLTFQKKVRLGNAGVRWLAIHGANVFGVDKVSMDDRVKWVQDNRELIEAVVTDPIGYRTLWGEADKPYQFLAFCYEWADCDYGSNTDFESSLPIGVDGTCNGLQHFAAMLRDSIGARATNLTDTAIPADIYSDVAEKCTEKLSQIDHPYARLWLRIGITRKCAKKPVMTLPYGATMQGAKHAILEYLMEHWDDLGISKKHMWPMTEFLARPLWDSIGETVRSAKECMQWLRNNIQEDLTRWITPIGFPVMQNYRILEREDITTQLCGGTILTFYEKDKEYEVDKTRQRNGVAPNFIHSLDSTHLVMTILDSGLENFMMIHDDYGTHAGNMDILAASIRRTFKELYDNDCPLEAWGKQVNADMDSIPQKGEYDINAITRATYFFS